MERISLIPFLLQAHKSDGSVIAVNFNTVNICMVVIVTVWTVGHETRSRKYRRRDFRTVIAVHADGVGSSSIHRRGRNNKSPV